MFGKDPKQQQKLTPSLKKTKTNEEELLEEIKSGVEEIVLTVNRGV